MRLLVTRPEPDGAATAEALRARGHEVLHDPMLRIVAEAGTEPLPAGIAAIAVTSANAVRALAARADFAALVGLPLHTVGGATARAARDAGFSRIVSADGNVDDLLELVAGRLDPAAGPILYACGRDRTGDLEQRLAARGFDVRLLVAYCAEAAPRLAEATSTALAAGAVDAVLLYSRRTAEIFLANLAAADHIEAARGIRMLCLSEAVAEPLRAAGFTDIAVADRPKAEALVALVGGET
ncbi:MAG TPA: uroporphyrinogen-III synthase [Hyphomicrobiales bacterium]|nr:uroporphyrinogen-III synthase [Kaistiaceae bacterium]HQF30096.1 uroporphyrinogen-III synthase [Hyphomicrobiales bacterium]